MEVAFNARPNVMGLPRLDDPAFVPLHNNPRFKRIVHALGQDQRVERMGRRVLAEQSVLQKSK
jgi:hypothetical protein